MKTMTLPDELYLEDIQSVQFFDYVGPMTEPWRQNIVYISDMDGFLIEICTPIPID